MVNEATFSKHPPPHRFIVQLSIVNCQLSIVKAALKRAEKGTRSNSSECEQSRPKVNYHPPQKKFSPPANWEGVKNII